MSDGGDEGRRVGSYIILHRIGSGSFGDVYVAVGDDGEQVAVKTEHLDRKPKLEREAQLLNRMASDCLPRMLRYDPGNPQHGVAPAMVMELLGRNLEEFRLECPFEKVPLPTLLRVYHQCITALEQVHSHGYVHRDVKPENFCISVSKDRILVCDLGLAKAFVEHGDDGRLAHVPFSQKKNCSSIAGTARFSSLLTHKGVHQTRRDEMEALLYGIRHLAYGQLPWSGLSFSDKKEKHRKMHEMKTATSSADLWGSLPPELPEAFALVRALEFAESPPYEVLRQLARKAFDREAAGPWKPERKPLFAFPLEEPRGHRRELEPPEGTKKKRRC